MGELDRSKDLTMPKTGDLQNLKRKLQAAGPFCAEAQIREIRDILYSAGSAPLAFMRIAAIVEPELMIDFLISKVEEDSPAAA